MGVIFTIALTLVATWCISNYYFRKTPPKVATKNSKTNTELKNILKIAPNENIKSLHYDTPKDTKSYYCDIMGLSTFWDSRYAMIITESKCFLNIINHSLSININKKTFQASDMDPETSLLRVFDNDIYPWRDDSSLITMVDIVKLKYKIITGNPVGELSFNIIVESDKTKEKIIYNIIIYNLGAGPSGEYLRHVNNPELKIGLINSIVDMDTKYSSYLDDSHILKTATSNIIEDSNMHYKASISQADIRIALEELNFDPDINNWKIRSMGIKTKIQKNSGHLELRIGFQDLESYILTELS